MIEADTPLPLSGKAWLVTGGTGGIGAEVVRGLVRLGAEVVFVGRNEQLAAALIRDVLADRPQASITFLAADLGDQGQVRRLAEQVMRRWPRLNGLINNAGGIYGRRELSGDGIERTMALNHLAPFLLTRLLLPVLTAAASPQVPSRVIVVSSNAHRSGRIDTEDPEGARGYQGWRAYRQSKLANLLFTYELAWRLGPAVVTVNALHPGFVATGIGTANGLLPAPVWWLAKRFGLSPEASAATILRVVTAAETLAKSGRYYVRGQQERSAPASYDRDTARWLWEWSERKTGLRHCA